MERSLGFRMCHVVLWGILVIVLWGAPALSACRSGPDGAAFAWMRLDDADPQPNGMMLMGYRDDVVGSVTHVAFHRVARVLPGVQEALPESEVARYTVLHTDGTLGPLTYVILRDALYYGTDLDAVGLPRRVWIDPDEDGVNGNERLIFDH